MRDLKQNEQQVLIKEEKLRDISEYEEIFRNGNTESRIIKLNRDDDAFTKTDVICSLNTLRTYFNGNDIERQMFEHHAAIIEAAYDYLQQRLIDSELDRFKLSKD